jgi:hypothetical protein
MPMKRVFPATAVIPLAAAIVVGGVLLGTGHAIFGSHRHRAGDGAHAVAARPFRCDRRTIATPFAGVAINPNISARVLSFEHATRAQVQVVEVFTAFGRPFAAGEAGQITALGALPLIQLNPRNISLAVIASGRYDARIRRYADAVRAFRCRVILSFGHEMNGWWYTWGRPDTTPAEFIAAWRHIHAVFSAQHVTNVTWSWDPSQQHRYKRASFASQWYPGDAYVDLVGIDGYLGRGQTFADVFAAQLRNIRGVTAKPVFLAETGVAAGPDQASQIAGLFAGLKSYHLAGLIWFDLNRKQPWRLEGRQVALAAYHRALASLGAHPDRAGRAGT